MDPLSLLTTSEGEDEGKGKDLRKKQRMDEAGNAIVPKSNECDFCKKECTGNWNESCVIWRRTCCLGRECAPSGSSSVGPPNTLEIDKDATAVAPPEVIQYMLQLRLDNPDMAVIEAVRCPGGWTVECGDAEMRKRIVFEDKKSKTNGLDKGGVEMWGDVAKLQAPVSDLA